MQCEGAKRQMKQKISFRRKLMTAVLCCSYGAEWLPETVAETALTLMALAYLVAGLCVMFAVFALRRLFREDQTPQPAA